MRIYESKKCRIVYDLPESLDMGNRRIQATPMPTAILIVPTSEGIVAASDGFGGRGNDSSKHEVKIFPIVSRYGHFLYGISGMASFLASDKKNRHI